MSDETIIYQLKISLKGTKPPIWRRVLVKSDIDLGFLHAIIQNVLAWDGEHAHIFYHRMSNCFFGQSGDHWLDEEDENQCPLDSVLEQPKAKLEYEYDFGDSWTHIIQLEKILNFKQVQHMLPYETNYKLPCCIKAKRAAPPEDCGGIFGFEDLVVSLENPSLENHEDAIEWLGKDFDPDYVDIDQINHKLAKLHQTN